MADFFDQPILNSPYERPGEHWELDENRQPTNKRIDSRRPASFIVPVPKPRRQRRPQAEMVFDRAAAAVGSDGQRYDLDAHINSLRQQRNQEAARVWISGLEAVHAKLELSRVIDLSATPFFLRGYGYAEGTLFPWTACDFSLMDAIECGIVKLPRVPVADLHPLK